MAAKRRRAAVHHKKALKEPAGGGLGRTPSVWSRKHEKASYVEKDRRSRSSFIRELRTAYRRTGLVLYVGAGVSASLGLPNWNTLLHRSALMMLMLKLEDHRREDETELYRSVAGFVTPELVRGKPALMMAREIKEGLQERLHSVLAMTLYERYFSRMRKSAKLARGKRRARMARRRRDPRFSKGVRARALAHQRLPSSKLLEAIVSLVRGDGRTPAIKAIINYNFDDILDRILNERGIPCRTVLSARQRIHADHLPCYHVHGLLPFYRGRVLARPTPAELGNFVFGEDEYHDEYSKPRRWSNRIQREHLTKHTGLFIGLSLEDPDIRRVIDLSHRLHAETTHYAILKRKVSLAKSRGRRCALRNLFEEIETNSFRKIGMKILWVDRFNEIPGILNSIHQSSST